MSLMAQIGKFGIVGLLNTLIDFGIFNVLTGGFGIAKVPANFCSTTIAMIFSFVANREAVFSHGSGDPLAQAVTFFVVTAFGLYVLQTGLLYLMVRRWQWPRRWSGRLSRAIGMPHVLSSDVILRNGAKGCGTVLSLSWNFVLYKYVVFR